MKKLVIIGAGDLGKQIACYVHLQNKYELIGFIDDNKSVNEQFDDFPILGSTSDINSLYKDKVFDCLFIAIGYTHFNLREGLYKKISDLEIELATIISPYACICPKVEIGQGCWISGNAFIGPNSKIKDNVAVNGGAQIAHDCIIEEHSFIAGSVVIGGFTKIGKRVMLGLHSTILDHLVIHDDVVVGAASVVRKNINQKGTFIEDKFFKNIFLNGR